MAVAEAPEILRFWFDEAGAEKWYGKDERFDGELTNRFAATYSVAAKSGLAGWAETPAGALSLGIVLDQFPRNMFRDRAEAFGTDKMALANASAALANGFDDEVAPQRRQFFYTPFMHSERLADQARSVALFAALTVADPALAKCHRYAVAHRDIVARFGRFPHRNEILGRVSSEEEAAFLRQPGSSF